MKTMIRVEDKVVPLHLSDAVSGNVMIRAEEMDRVVGWMRYKKWRPLTYFERIKFRLGFTIVELEYR